MRQNNYYKTNAVTIAAVPHLISYSFRTKKVIIYKSKTNFGVADNFMTIEHCESNVKNKFWTRISYKEFIDLLNEIGEVYNTNFDTKIDNFTPEPVKTSRYFIRNDCKTFPNTPCYKFWECTPNNKVIAHVSKTENYESCYTSEVVINNKCWTEITKDEALKLLEDLPVVKADTVIPSENDIVYYDHVTGFKSNVFMSANLKTRKVFLHTLENISGNDVSVNKYTFETCEKYVKEGQWKHITKEQAYDKFKHKEIVKTYTDETIILPNIRFFILTKKSTSGILYFKYIDLKNWTWVNNFDECTKFSGTFVGDKFKEIRNNLITPLWENDKEKLYWIQMNANKTSCVSFSA